jgi:glycosyltransferase involved in cell wall biosynthesis
MLKNLSYVAEFSLPNNKAYAIHVLKMLNALNEHFSSCELIIPYKDNKYEYNYLAKNFLLKKKKIYIKSIFVNKYQLTFLLRIIFSLKAAIYIKNDNIIITRSVITSFFLILFKKTHVLEIHHEFYGLSKFLFLNFNFINSKYIRKLICVSKSLKNFYKKKTKNSIALPDAVDVEFYKIKKIQKKIKNVYYIGSFYKGRGIELIIEIAKILKNINFILYGLRNDDSNNLSNLPKNIKIFKFIEHSKVPKLLYKADLVLMPYSLSHIGIASIKNNINTVKYASPLKMFEYLASGTPLMASNLKVLKEILKNNYNSIIVKDNNPYNWVSEIIKLQKNIKLKQIISMNAIKTANKNTWSIRAIKMLKYFK